MTARSESTPSSARFLSQVLVLVLLVVVAIAAIPRLGPRGSATDASGTPVTPSADQELATAQRNWLDDGPLTSELGRLLGTPVVREVIATDLGGAFDGQNLYQYRWSVGDVDPAESLVLCGTAALTIAANSPARRTGAEDLCARLPQRLVVGDSPGPIVFDADYDADSSTFTLSYEPI